MNPKPTCRSYTEDFTNTVVQEADDWSPTSTNVDMVNISGSKSAYKIKDGMLTLRMMRPEFNANGKPKTEGVAATLDMAFEMQYGAIEVKMKVSPVNGVCTSVNTMSENGDEIDIEM
jgi:beta-glucanase (GH16 family)